MKGETGKKKHRKRSELTRANLLSLQSQAQDWESYTERKLKKKKHEDQFSINQLLKDEIKKKINFKKEPKQISKSTRVNLRNS